MNKYEDLQAKLRTSPKRWLITGVAGFIGSNLLETLLNLDQHVVGLDNFATGHQRNLDEVQKLVKMEQWGRFRFIRGDICNLPDCREAVAPNGHSVDFVLHQAALGSVPRSLEFPLKTHASNVEGFINLLTAARDASVRRFVFASSSSVYGDNPALPKLESAIGKPLSPYAATKLMDEIYAEVYYRCYQTPVVGLRYFNVFGPRQDPNGAYAAVIPRWFASMARGAPIHIYGDGETSRDFCFIGNVIQANLLAALTNDHAVSGRFYNIAFGGRTTLNDLYGKIKKLVVNQSTDLAIGPPVFWPERPGDVRHSLADITLAKEYLGYNPKYSVDDGLKIASEWYKRIDISTNS